jgi:hypothetical protein
VHPRGQDRDRDRDRGPVSVPGVPGRRGPGTKRCRLALLAGPRCSSARKTSQDRAAPTTWATAMPAAAPWPPAVTAPDEPTAGEDRRVLNPALGDIISRKLQHRVVVIDPMYMHLWRCHELW